jgi:riboflavin transporter FmnP
MWKGIGLGLVLHLLQFALVPVVVGIDASVQPGAGLDATLRALYIGMISIAATQFLYILPVMHVYKKRGERETVKGLAIAAGITVLLCAVLGYVLRIAVHF